MKEFKIESIIIHPDWNTRKSSNDIALLIVKELTFDKTIKPIALPPDENFKETISDYRKKTEIVTAGWGDTIDSYFERNFWKLLECSKSL